MTVARQYVLVAAEGRGRELEDALRQLATLVRPVADCEGIEILRDAGDGDRFVFIEKWASVEAHKAGARLLAKDAFDPVMATLRERPAAAYLEYVQRL